MDLTRNNLTIGDERPDVSFPMSLETAVATGAMLAQLKVQIQLLVDLLHLIIVNPCVRKFDGGVLEMLSAFEVEPYLSKSWCSKVRTIVAHTQQF